MAQSAMEQAQQEKAMELEAEARENEKDRRKDLLVAEIKASGYGAMQDINQNLQSDFADQLDKIKDTQQYQDTVNIQQEKLNQNQANQNQKMNLKREEMALKRDMKNKDLEIARENKNQYELKNQKGGKDK
jgi:hypothetical protein